MIIVVSGMPRSGTSLMMQMLGAGGVPVLSDGVRAPDENNPRGYLEFEKVKRIREDRSWLDEAEGRAVKIVSHLLPELPPGRTYRVVFMQRDIGEVVASQRAMLERLGRAGAPLPGEELAGVLGRHLASVEAWLRDRPGVEALFVQHRDVIRDPRREAQRVRDFLGLPCDVEAMAAAVDVSLHRHRGGP
jgi:hypothetical protein